MRAAISSRSRAKWISAIGVGAAATGALYLISDSLRGPSAIGIYAAGISFLGLVVAMRRAGCVAWWLIFGGCALIVPALGLQAFVDADGAQSSSLALFLAGHVSMGAGLFLRFRIGMRESLDVLAVGVLVAYPLLVLAFSLAAAGSADETEVLARSFSLLLGILLVTVPLVTLVRGADEITGEVRLILAGACAVTVADAIRLVDFGVSGADLGWIAGGASATSVAALALAAGSAQSLVERDDRAARWLMAVPLVVAAPLWVVAAEVALRSADASPQVITRLGVYCGATLLIVLAYRFTLARRDVLVAVRAMEIESERFPGTFRFGIGQLTAGIAHDLTNVIWVLELATAAARRKSATGESITAEVEEVARASATARRIVERLRRAVSDEDQIPLEEIDLAEAARHIASIASRRSPGGCRVQVIVRQRVVLRAPRPTVDQVLLNLIGNACTAAGASGVVRVIVEADEGVGSLLVEDDGPGVPDELREKIFAPFFSTRSSGGGEGLGLSIVQAASAEMGGVLRLDSPRDPTRFVVAFPIEAGLQ